MVALVVLLALAAVALRGYLPGGERPPREQPESSPLTVLAVVTLLVTSLAIIAIATIMSRRNPREAAGSVGDLSEGAAGRAARLKWRRFVLIVAGLILIWLLMVVALVRLLGPPDIGQPAGTESSTDPGGGATVPPGDALPDRTPEPSSSVFGYLVAATVILLLLIAVGSVIASRRRRSIAQPPLPYGDGSPPVSRSESLVRAAELGLAEIAEPGREPREGIIACYAAMERALADAPEAAPRDSDTPSEVLARAVEHHALRADSASELVDLFAEARFSPHVMNERHRDDAVRILRLVLTELQSVA